MDREDRFTPETATPWSKLLRRTVVLLAIWFLVGPVLGILLVEPLNAVSLGGIPLGFWISQQGSIYVFILLIFAYAVLGDRADRGDLADRVARARGESQPGTGGGLPGSTGREG